MPNDSPSTPIGPSSLDEAETVAALSTNPAKLEKLSAEGHAVVDASPELVAAVDAIYDSMVADWVEAAKAAGVSDPEAMLSFYNETYSSLAAK